MKVRRGLIVLVVITILVGGISLDANGLRLWVGLQSGTVISQVTAENTLKPCSSSKSSYSGPLIPAQSTNIAHSRNEVIIPIGNVPVSSWSQRIGFGISTQADPQYWASILGVGWYLDWRARVPGENGKLEYWPMVRVHTDCISPGLAEIKQIAAQASGLVWIIGNEPDVIWQDNVAPGRYAFVYHALYYVIKSVDSSARVAAGGVSQATPLRLGYLDQVLKAYESAYQVPMPVDWWTLHGYVLREERGSWGVDIPPGSTAAYGELREVADHGRIDLFKSQIQAFRQWMKAHGYQDTPLSLTEFGILMPASYGFTDHIVEKYMEETFSWLYAANDENIGNPQDQYHLVQKWAWFSLADPLYPTSDLANLESGNLTSLGEFFRGMLVAVRP